jgi:hypothetical protein
MEEHRRDREREEHVRDELFNYDLNHPQGGPELMRGNEKPPADDLELVKRQITQICNAQLFFLREVHEYLVPMARKFGVELDAAGESSWAMSCWIEPLLGRARSER